MARRFKFKPPAEIENTIKDILENAKWENMAVWDDFYSQFGWKLAKIKRYHMPCDYHTLGLGWIYSLKGFVFIPPQLEKYQSIYRIYINVRYNQLLDTWDIRYRVQKKRAKATLTSKQHRKGRASELGKVITRISYYYRVWIKGKPASAAWYEQAIKYAVWYFHNFKTRTNRNIWQWIIKQRFNLCMYSSFTPSIIPETNFRQPLYPVLAYEEDFETPELFIIVKHDETAVDSLYKIRAVKCRCPIYTGNYKRLKLLTSHDGKNGLKIPVLQNLLGRFKHLERGGVMLIVERVWRKSGASAVSYLWIEDEILNKLKRIQREETRLI